MVGIEQEAGGAAGGVADALAELGRDQLGDELDDMAWGAELAVFTRAADLAEEHFIDIALDVLEVVAFLAELALDFEVDLFDNADGGAEQVGTRYNEDGIGHLPGEGAGLAIERLDEGEAKPEKG